MLLTARVIGVARGGKVRFFRWLPDVLPLGGAFFQLRIKRIGMAFIILEQIQLAFANGDIRSVTDSPISCGAFRILT